MSLCLLLFCFNNVSFLCVILCTFSEPPNEQILFLHVTEYLSYLKKEYIFVWLFFFNYFAILFLIIYTHLVDLFTESVEEQ